MLFSELVTFISNLVYKASAMYAPYSSLFEQLDTAESGADVSQSFKWPEIKSCENPNISKYAFTHLKSPCEPDNCNVFETVLSQNLKPFTKKPVFSF